MADTYDTNGMLIIDDGKRRTTEVTFRRAEGRWLLLQATLNAHLFDEFIRYGQKGGIVLYVRSANQIAVIHHQGGDPTNIGIFHQHVASFDLVEDTIKIERIAEYFGVNTL